MSMSIDKAILVIEAVDVEEPTTEEPTTEEPTTEESSTDDNDKYLLGDVNLDGRVTAADARLALRIAAQLEDITAISRVALHNADVITNNKIDAADARLILRVSAQLDKFE